jgi:DNA-binding beta-propeller fold protein YncE
MRKPRALLMGVLCVGLLLGGVSSAQATAPEPDRVMAGPLVLPPNQFLELEDLCGMAVASASRFYVSNYYSNTVHWINPTPPPPPPYEFGLQLFNVDSLGGPCGLSLDGLGRIYVNNYHRNVERYSLSGGSSQTPLVIDSSHPTGVAVNPATNDVYVNARTYLSAYGSSGAPLMDGPDPLRIGEGSLGDGYGLAVSQFAGTTGRIYAPDHSDDTVKVYDPLIDIDNPVQTITGPPGGFGSLRDSAVAVDRVTGEIYVADTRAYPQYTELPEAVIQIFAPDGTYKGRLKYNLVDPSPVGLAVDNALGAGQGRVYVTSGNTFKSSVYIYPPGSATSQSAPPLMGTSKVKFEFTPAEAGAISAEPETRAAASSVVAQKGTLRVAVDGKLAPKRLPRKGIAPISVSVGGEISTTDRSLPPQLQSMRIELNKGGKLDTAGLPPCPYDSIQPGSTQRALSACRDSLVGKGSFTANITLAGQEAYPTGGKLLLFHSVERGKPVLYGHIYSAKPFATSFVIVFAVSRVQKGVYGTALNAPLPKAMDAWGRLTGLQMTLSRRYSYNGKAHSFISAGCPAPKGFTSAVFPLAQTEFSFADGTKLRSKLMSQCKVRGD